MKKALCARLLVGTALAMAAASSAQAASIYIVASGNWEGQTTVGDPSYSVTAYSSTSPYVTGTIGIKSIPGAGAGAGVEGQGNDEIDVYVDGTNSEALRFDFSQPGVITSLVLGLLFDGPEYSDWEEVARFNVLFADDPTVHTFTLTTNYLGSTATGSTWDGGSVAWVSEGVVLNGSGLWSNSDPFAGRFVRQIELSAATATTCYTGSAANCADQSDYVFRSMSVNVPEPATLSLLGLSMLGVGFARRARRS